MNLALLIFILFVCAAISFLLSGMEAGVFALSRLRIRQLHREGDARAGVLLGYLDRPENFLWTILVGNTVANFVAFALLGFSLHHWLPGRNVGNIVLFVFEIFLFYALCELLPKMLFRLYPNRLSLFLAGPFRFIHFFFKPLVALVSLMARWLLRWTGGRRFTGHLFGNRDELRFLMQESAQGLTTEEQSMINRVLDLQNVALREITVPLARVTTVPGSFPMGEVLRICREQNLTRLPVRESENGRVVGLLSLRTLLYGPELDPDRKAVDYIKPALFLNENLRLEEGLRRLQRSGQRMAIVLSHDQQEVGIVTIEDILKFIFGEVTL